MSLVPEMRGRRSVQIIALVLAYYLGGRLGLGAATVHSVVSSLWPPAGIALFALLYVGPDLWPGVAIGAFLINVSSGIPWGSALGMATGNTLEALLAATLLSRRKQFTGSFDRMAGVLDFGLLAALGSTLIAATIGVTSLTLGGAAGPGSFVTLWRAWWSGDAVGMLVITPLLLTWTTPAQANGLDRRRFTEAALTLAVLVAAAWAVLRGSPYAYPIFPLVFWIAFRFGQRGATVAIALVTVIASWLTVHGAGPFAQSTPNDNLLLLQLFVALLAMSALLFGAALAERLAAERRAREGASQLNAARQLARLGTWHWHVRTDAVKLSPEMLQILGLPTPGPRTMMDLLSHAHNGDRASLLKELQRAAAESRSLQLTARFVRSDQDTRVLAAYGEPILEESGRVAALGGMCQDLTDEWRSRDALLEREELLRPLLDRSDVGLALISLDGRFMRSNRTYEKLLGYSEDELQGRTLADITHEEDWPLNRRLLQEVEEGTSPWFRMDKRLIRKDGRLIAVHNTVSGIPGPGGRPSHFVSMVEAVQVETTPKDRVA